MADCENCIFYEGEYCPLGECNYKPIWLIGMTERDFDKPTLS